MASGLSTQGDSMNVTTRAQERFQQQVAKYFKMLTEGCGNEDCVNSDCASYKRAHGESIPPPNKAAVSAVRLLKEKKRLCTENKSVSEETVNGRRRWVSSSLSPNGTHRSPEGGAVVDGEHNEAGSTASMEVNTPHIAQRQDGRHRSHFVEGMEMSSGPQVLEVEAVQESARGGSMMVGTIEMESSQSSKPSGAVSLGPPPEHVTKQEILDLIEAAKQSSPPNYSTLKSTIWSTFSCVENLNGSFLLPGCTLQYPPAPHTPIAVDVDAVKEVFLVLDSLQDKGVSTTLINAIIYYSRDACMPKYVQSDAPLNHSVIMLENPLLANPEYLEQAVPALLHSITLLSTHRRLKLVSWYADYSAEPLRDFVTLLQQSVAFTIAMDESEDIDLQGSEPIMDAVKVLHIFYFANLVAAKNAGSVRPDGELVQHLRDQKDTRGLSPYEEMLVNVGIHPANILDPPVPFVLFLNEELNQRIDMEHDLQMRLDPSSSGTSFYHYPCCLAPVNKVEELRWDNQLNMMRERRLLMFHALLSRHPIISPFFVLRVDRHNLIQDTLTQLEIYSEDSPDDLKKQLRVQFRGEEGLDEGGVQKEFFQLLIEELFNQDFGMFTYDEVHHQFWFNPFSYESEREYMLIGILLGLAIYNNVILDVHFPMVVYRKIMGCGTVFSDLFSSHEPIAKGLKDLLQYDGDDFENTFGLTFCVQHSDMFQQLHHHELKPSGADIAVTEENREEYAQLYCDWLINESIATQFNSFKKGFGLVIRGTSLINMFRPEELEQLICGLSEWNFEELEASTSYEGGFSRDHVVIRNFWEVVHDFSEDQKKQFLQFVTGTDRVPLGGLSKLKFMVVKNGSDSDRLPTAHTCFNALLLCEYSSKEKLKDRLLKAITHAKGFGML